MWQRYLSYGGFPVAVAAAKAGQPVPQHFVDDLFDVIANDTFANSRLNSLTEIALLERLWTAMGSPANLAKIAADTGVSQEVVSRHVGYLRDAFLLWACPQKSESSWLPHPGTQSKLYAVDPLVARLPHLRNAERSDIDLTILAEMQIGQASAAARYTIAPGRRPMRACSTSAPPHARRSTSSPRTSQTQRSRASSSMAAGGAGRPRP